VVYVSNDAGSNWTELSGLNRPNASATPKLAVGPLLGTPLKSSLWLSYSDSSGARAAGIEVRNAGTSNMGPTWTGPTTLPSSGSSVFTSITVGPTGEVAVAHVARSVSPPTVYLAVNTNGLGSTNFLNQASAAFALKYGDENFPVNAGLSMPPIPTLDWDRARNKLYIVYPDRPATNSVNDTDIYVRYSTNKGAAWIPASGSNGHKANTGAPLSTEFHPRLSVDQKSGFVGVVWYDGRQGAAPYTNAWLFASVSTNGFATAQPRNFQVNPARSSADVAVRSYKEYIGLRYQSGFLYPAWLDNSNYKANAPTPTNQFEIYTSRIPF